MDLATIGMDAATESFVVEHIAKLVTSGALSVSEITVEVVVAAIHEGMRHQMRLIDNRDAIRIVADRAWCTIKARGGAAVRREITDAIIEAAPADGRDLLRRARSART